MKFLALMKKEFLRFFSDPRLLISMLMPGIVIYAIYSVMGAVISDSETSYRFDVLIYGNSAAISIIEETAESAGYTLSVTQTDDYDGAVNAVKSGQYTAFIAFTDGFDEAVSTYGASSGAAAFIYYRSADDASYVFYAIASGILDGYYKPFVLSSNDFSDAADTVVSVMGSFLPMIVVMMIFSSCMGIALESVAGEKERGTLATILVTPIKRIHIALGKTIPLCAVTLIGALSSFLGIMFSLPSLVGLSVGAFFSGIGLSGGLLLLLLVLSIAPVSVTLITAVSAFANTVKEGSAYTGIILVIVMALTLVSSFITLGGWVVAVPILNAVVLMQNIIAGSLAVWQTVTAVLVNLLCTALLVLVIAAMLGSEKIMFGK